MNNYIDNIVIGNLIRALRSKYNLSQQQLADELLVSKGAVCQWENGSGIKTENLYDISKFFNITISELIEGRLIEESDDDYYGRNFNLDGFDSFDLTDVDEKKHAELIEYLSRCKKVVNRIMTLFPDYISDNLGKKQSDEFDRLFKYFEIDHKYANYYSIPFTLSLKSMVKRLKRHGVSNSKELDFELQKIYSLKSKVTFDDFYHVMQSDAAPQMYLDTRGQYEKNDYLTQSSFLFRIDTKEEIMMNELIKNGAECLSDVIFSTNRTNVGSECFKLLTGAIKEDVRIRENKNLFFNKTSNSNAKTPELFEYISSWKHFTYPEYLSLIDKERTQDYRDYFTLRREKPDEYYEKLVKRNDLRCYEVNCKK